MEKKSEDKNKMEDGCCCSACQYHEYSIDSNNVSNILKR